ncbi:MAG: peptide chain release factor N(5)-glutamine methyltransferase [Campylobacteraceae bacterium]|jgi:release factor glutamine methyltransferase|nr:peptide chain release factor N(5)-glutamine methyltransferase [Campylobacteraceae bacterium]
MLSAKELLDIGAKMLQNVANPRREAFILLREWMRKDDSFLVAHDETQVQDVDGFLEWIKRRAEHTPLEYITKKVSFYSREFEIEEGVLVPRPETEILVDKTVELVREFNAKNVAEIGVGSGVVSIILALLLPNIRIKGSDINEKAVALSRRNAKKFGVQDRAEFYFSNYLDGFDKPDIIVSNPPYVSTKENLEKHVLNEPHSALFGGTCGDEILKSIVLLSLKFGGVPLVCEMGYDQKNCMELFFQENGIKNYSFYQDLSGLDRGFIIKGQE